MGRIATYTHYQRNVDALLAGQKRMADAQLKISSGMKSPDYAGISRDARRLVNVEITHMRISQYKETNALVETRLAQMENTVAQLMALATDFKTMLVNGLNANNALDLAMKDQAQGKLDQVTALLNTKLNGRYLFSGNMTNTEPVDQGSLPASYTIPTSDDDAIAYYQGDTTKLSVRADENFDVTYGVYAGEAGFERLIRSLHMIVVGTPGDRDELEDSLKAVNAAIDDLPDLRSRIGFSRKTLEDANSRHLEFLLLAENTISELENADITKVITKLNQDQVLVEAAMTVLARISRLSLVNFMNN